MTRASVWTVSYTHLDVYKRQKLLPKNEAEARAIEKGLEGAEYTVGELKKRCV